MTDPRTLEQHGSRIIAALEHAWAAIQDAHPDVPDVVIVTGAGSNQKGTPEGYQLRGHHESFHDFELRAPGNWDEPGVSLRGTGTGLDDHGLVYGP